MISATLTTKKINSKTISWLKQKNIDIPVGAKSFEYIVSPKLKDYTELITFKNKNLRLKQYKTTTNRNTQQKTVQIREYDCLQNGKATEINQTNITPDGKETKENWRFYYSKDKSNVRFSRKNKNGETNNYLHSEGVFVDNEGLRIRPISTAEYCDKRKDINNTHFVDCPWTLQQSITTKDVCATDSIQECTVVGIYGKNGLSLNHLNPNNPKNKNFDTIETTLLEQLEQQGKNAKAFVIGACEDDINSNNQFNSIIDLLTTRKIPHSRFKTGDKVLYSDSFSLNKYLFKKTNTTASPMEWQSGHHIIYNNGELLIANPIIDNELKKGNTNSEDLIQKSFSYIRK